MMERKKRVKRYSGLVLHVNEKSKVILLCLNESYLFVSLISKNTQENKHDIPKIGDYITVIDETFSSSFFSNENHNYDNMDENHHNNKFYEKMITGRIESVKSHNNHICKSKLRHSIQRQAKLCKTFQIGKICADKFCPFRHYFISRKEEMGSRRHQGHLKAMEEMRRDANDYWPEEKKKSLGHRHFLFAEFVLQTYGKEYLIKEGKKALDVGGGYGYLAHRLFDQFDVKCIVVDPMKVDERDEEVERAFERTGEKFDMKFAEENEEVIKNCSVVLGLHPDEATEEIVEVALKYGKPFCLVPCCLHTKYKFIYNHEEYVENIIKMCNGKARVDFLNMKGRNKIIYIEPNEDDEEEKEKRE